MNTQTQSTRNAAQQPAATILNFAIPAQADLVDAREKVVGGRRRAHPDRKLIEACVEYAFQRCGAEACFVVDPTDSEFASFTDDIARSRAARVLTTATRCRPSTMDGLRAQAALIPVMFADGTDNYLDPSDRTFLLSLSADIVRLQQSAMGQKQSRVQFPEPRR
jgi:hypothetical protein